jgi:hypothetical protein
MTSLTMGITAWTMIVLGRIRMNIRISGIVRCLPPSDIRTDLPSNDPLPDDDHPQGSRSSSVATIPSTPKPQPAIAFPTSGVALGSSSSPSGGFNHFPTPPSTPVARRVDRAAQSTPTTIGRILHESGLTVAPALVSRTLADAMVTGTPDDVDSDSTLDTLTMDYMAFISTQDNVNVNVPAAVKQLKRCIHVASYLPLDTPASSTSEGCVAETITLLFARSLAYDLDCDV